jgi:transposase
LVEQTVAPDDPDPKALACYGLLLPDCAAVWLRFVSGRPVSAATTDFLAWCCERLAAEGKQALLLVWDHAGWHGSQAVRSWLRDHNQAVKRAEARVRIVVCFLPVKSPWLNPIEPHWAHAKRKVVEPDRVLTARELEERVCAHFGCPVTSHLVIPQKVA